MRFLPVVSSAVVVATFGLAGCGAPTRSASAYCRVFVTQGGALRASYEESNPNADPLASLGLALTAPSRLARFFGQLDRVAPDEIEPDVAAVQHAFQQLGDGEGQSLVDPVGGLAQGFGLALGSAASFQSVDAWTAAHCSLPGASSPAAR